MEQTPRLSPSIAKILCDPELTPYHAYCAHYALGGGKVRTPDTDAQQRGKLVDKLLFGVGDEVIIRKPRERVDAAWGTIVCTQAAYDSAAEIAAIASAAWSAKFGKNPNIVHAQPRWKWIADGGISCSGRPDYYDIETGGIVDLKTCKSIGDRGLGYAIRDYGWDIQAAAYLEAASALYDRKDVTIEFMAVEAGEPNNVRWVTLSPNAIGEGTGKWRRACRTWKECLASGVWPAYDDYRVTTKDESIDTMMAYTKGTK